MPLEQLLILGYEAARFRNDKHDETLEMVTMVAQATRKYFSKEFEYLRLFVNPRAFNKVQELKDMEKFEQELKPEDVPAEFAKLEEMGLDELEVIELEKPEEEAVPLPDDIIEALNQNGFENFSASFLTTNADLGDIDFEEE